ncbi:MAG: hypothetical protein ACTHN5_10655 [Phycisphaerae bacterium]
MNRLHMLIIAIFTVALGTGFVVGMGITRPTVAHKPPGRSWLVEKLQLSPEQGEKIKAVWSQNLHDSWKRRSDAIHQFRKERDDALMSLLSPEQKTAYEKILTHYNDQITELNHEQEAAFQAAAEKTKELLDDHQRQLYDELLKKGFHPRDAMGGPPGPHPDGGHEGHEGREGRPWRNAPPASQPGAI